MTLPTSGPLSLADIDAEFSLGNDLYNYHGVTWYNDLGGSGVFSSGHLSIFEFYGKRPDDPSPPDPPVTPGSQTFTTDGVFTPPGTYNNLYVRLEGGTGTGQTVISYTGSEGEIIHYDYYTGGVGGLCLKNYTYATGPHSNVSVIFASVGGAQFYFGTVPYAINGGNAYEAYVGSGTDGPITQWNNGANGAAYGGDTNTTGGSTVPAARAIISWD